MLLDEYVLLAVEGQLHGEAETALQGVLEKHMQPGGYMLLLGSVHFFRFSWLSL